jgi:DNA (cytosine-5)-methyltransferase 1
VAPPQPEPQRCPVSSDLDKVMQEKLAAIRSGRAPRVLDLFAGCGGLSLGFQSAGFEIAAAIEFDPIAAESHARNFFRDIAEEDRGQHAKARDIRDTDAAGLCAEHELGPPARAFDVLVGGPPCQAFARVGRAKLREVASEPTAFKQDPRGNLYLRYLKFVEDTRPVALLMENVPDVLNYGGHNIPEEMCEVLRDLGYRCAYTLVNAAFYGVPQMRDRLFMIGIHESVGCEPLFPSPSHWIDLPTGYHGTRAVAMNGVAPDLFSAPGGFLDPPHPDRGLPPAVTAEDALSDLPPITLHLEGRLKRGARRFVDLAEYESKPTSVFAKLMREWPGYEACEGVYDHVIRYLPRDYRLFARMEAGDQYPQAHALANRVFQEELQERRSSGETITDDGTAYRELHKSIVPPYDVGKFPNKWRKMEPDAPARTLMAHLGKDGYSHIHYDSEQARTISVREAARLQSFPDGFVFCGTMNPAFRQIGNAVPPLLAKHLGEYLLESLRGDSQ